MHRNGPKQRVLNNTVYTVCIQFVDSVVGRSAYKQKAEHYKKRINKKCHSDSDFMKMYCSEKAREINDDF